MGLAVPLLLKSIEHDLCPVFLVSSESLAYLSSMQGLQYCYQCSAYTAVSNANLTVLLPIILKAKYVL